MYNQARVLLLRVTMRYSLHLACIWPRLKALTMSRNDELGGLLCALGIDSVKVSHQERLPVFLDDLRFINESSSVCLHDYICFLWFIAVFMLLIVLIYDF